MWKFLELTPVRSRSAGPANRCVAQLSDGGQGLKARTHSQEPEYQMRRALAFSFCLFHFGEHDVRAVHSRGVAEHETPCGEWALDRRCVHLREWVRNAGLMRGATLRSICDIYSRERPDRLPGSLCKIGGYFVGPRGDGLTLLHTYTGAVPVLRVPGGGQATGVGLMDAVVDG